MLSFAALQLDVGNVGMSGPRSQPMSSAANQVATRAYFEKLWNRGDLTIIDAIMVPEIKFHYPLGDLFGADALKQYVGTVRAAFPDIRFAITELFGDEDRVAVRWSLSGTQTGSFKGRPPSGVAVNVQGITVVHLTHGKIHEMRVSFDPSRLVGHRPDSK
ncbi:MAG: ester cyclase [Pseudolabrys sp.]